ncbi:MAG TPA: glycosyl hydrolase [Rheinheimera sp.]|uniref:lysozyme n=1 Tax=Rheinheimera sp. TaxID=1869214 RepID=UPI000ECFB836|nr:lysozyme [Rheinheimera sp.]HCU64560.1 glycosyl hydrolase [Rheinheimera sp.]
MNPIQKKLAALGITGALSLSAAFLIVPSEGEVRKVYLDPARILTSCFGHTGPELRMGQTFTEEECLNQLVADLHKHDRQLRSVVKVPLSEGEHAAYLSFIYNVGYGRKDGANRGRDGFAVLRNGKPSTMLSLLNSGQRLKACDQLLAWIKIDGKESAGLRTRRAKERKVCLKDLTK